MVVAPFPPSHPGNVLNPIIEPWWIRLDKETQGEVYNAFTQSVEPLLLAKAKAQDMLKRKSTVAVQLLHALKDLTKAKLKTLVNIKAGDEVVPEHEEEYGAKDGMKGGKSTVKFKGYVHQKWEEVQALMQLKTHLFLSGKRAKFDALEEFVRLIKNKDELKSNLYVIKDAIKSVKENDAKEPEPELEIKKAISLTKVRGEKSEPHLNTLDDFVKLLKTKKKIN